jgi:hypothetical protein
VLVSKRINAPDVIRGPAEAYVNQNVRRADPREMSLRFIAAHKRYARSFSVGRDIRFANDASLIVALPILAAWLQNRALPIH